MTTETTRLSIAEYATLDDPEDDYSTELIRGVLVREPRPRRAHGRVQVKLAYHLEDWASEHGAEVTVESGFVLSEEPPTIRGPDVAVVLEPRAGEDEIAGWVRGAPDLAVEVLSPSDTSTSVQQKALEYLESGARRVWIVDPAARTVLVHRPDGSATLLRAHDTLDGEDVLEGFSVALGKILP